MAVKDWSTTAASNTGIISGMSLDGAVMTVNQTDNAFRDIAAQIAAQLGKMGVEGADIASATTTDLNNATGWSLDITGTTTITGFGTVDAGPLYILRFTGALTLTHNATSLILPGGANITTAAGDVFVMKSEGSGNWRCVGFQPAAGYPRLSGTNTWTGAQTYSSTVALDGTATVKAADNVTTTYSFVLRNNANTQTTSFGAYGMAMTAGSRNYTITAHDNTNTTYPIKFSNAAGTQTLEIGGYGIASTGTGDLNVTATDDMNFTADGGNITFHSPVTFAG